MEKREAVLLDLARRRGMVGGHVDERRRRRLHSGRTNRERERERQVRERGRLGFEGGRRGSSRATGVADGRHVAIRGHHAARASNTLLMNRRKTMALVDWAGHCCGQA